MTVQNRFHATEVKAGKRFPFGKNWRGFIAVINEERIELAKQSLQSLIGERKWDGKTFLDIGSGSGLFSLAARLLGAQVRSFDYDPESVGCTNELRQRYFPNDENWIIEQGSILDSDFLSRLGQHDIVYAWGVLHHTGQMWSALEKVKPLVRLGGRLVIAIYNDQGAITDRWLAIKRKYNSLPSLRRIPFAISIIAPIEYRTLLTHWRNKDLGRYLRSWTEYPLDARGMSRWYDWLDWIGGYPYECASIEAIVDFFGKDGFQLAKLAQSPGYGCNEFVFSREADLGNVLEVPLLESRFFLRRFGHRLERPFARTELGYVSKLPGSGATVTPLLIFHGDEFVGTACRGSEADTLVVAPAEWPDEKAAKMSYHYVPGYTRELASLIYKQRGYMWSVSMPDLAYLADNSPGTNSRSPIAVFENGQQLLHPHSIHDDIATYGAGRLSHWGNEVYFSTSDNSDPNENGRRYRLVYPAPLSQPS